jgi:hypothetical protein
MQYVNVKHAFVCLCLCVQRYFFGYMQTIKHTRSLNMRTCERESGTWVQSCVIPEIANIRSIGTLELEYIRSIMVLVVCSKSPQTTCPKPRPISPKGQHGGFPQWPRPHGTSCCSCCFCKPHCIWLAIYLYLSMSISIYNSISICI